LIFFIIFNYFFTNLKGDPQGVVAGKMDHYPWCIRQGAPGVSRLSPAHKASIHQRYFFKSEFHFSNFELLSLAHRLSIRQ
jgi:hypothetical protein